MSMNEKILEVARIILSKPEIDAKICIKHSQKRCVIILMPMSDYIPTPVLKDIFIYFPNVTMTVTWFDRFGLRLHIDINLDDEQAD